MQITAWLEIIIIALAMVIVPFIVWLFHQLRKSLLAHVNLVINEHYTSLESLIDKNRTDIYNLKLRLKHRAEIASIKYNALTDKIEEIELYLEKSNGYRRRVRLRSINVSDIDKNTMTEKFPDDDDDLSMAF